MSKYLIKVSPNPVAYADPENFKLVVEFAVPGGPTTTIDMKILLLQPPRATFPPALQLRPVRVVKKTGFISSPGPR
jgi:hypothetical protein